MYRYVDNSKDEEPLQDEPLQEEPLQEDEEERRQETAHASEVRGVKIPSSAHVSVCP
jgi:hypothetical protein